MKRIFTLSLLAACVMAGSIGAAEGAGRAKTKTSGSCSPAFPTSIPQCSGHGNGTGGGTGGTGGVGAPIVRK